MTAQEIAKRVLLDDGRDLTPERIVKLKGLCARAANQNKSSAWTPAAQAMFDRVVALLPEAERAKVQG